MPQVYEHTRTAGPFVFVSGQTPQLESGDVPDDIDTQATIAMDKIASLVAEHGLTLADLMKVTYFVTDIGELEEIRDALDAVLPRPRPTATLVEVSRLVDARFRIEIDAIAYRA